VPGRGGGEGAGDWPAALARYAEIRFPRTSRVQQTARLWGDIWHVDGVSRLLSDDSGWMTGQALHLNGGLVHR
jgi:hypothetical protein